MRILQSVHPTLKVKVLGPITALALACLVAPAETLAQNAYITNASDNTVSVINTTTNTVVGEPIPVGTGPFGVAVTSDGSKVYVTNGSDNTVSVIDTTSNTIASDPIPVGTKPLGVAVTPDGSKVYVANAGAFPPTSGNVSVINAASNTVITTIAVGGPGFPAGIALSPDGRKVYVLYSYFSVTGGGGFGLAVIDTASDTRVSGGFVQSPYKSVGGVAVSPDGSKIYVVITETGAVSVFDTASNTRIGDPIAVGGRPYGVAITPDGGKIYVTNGFDNTVSVIDAATNTVSGGPIPVGSQPLGVAVSPDGRKVYVANEADNTVSVIDTATDTVIADPIPVGATPSAFGLFIQPARKFAGTPGQADCRHKSIFALLSQYGELEDAAKALNYEKVRALRHAIKVFCAA